jgi:hypothetical protein
MRWLIHAPVLCCAVTPVGTVGTQQSPVAAGNNLPPGPPMDWSTMQHVSGGTLLVQATAFTWLR